MARVLLIEDDPKIRTYLRRILEPRGHEIMEADNGHVGLEVIRRERVDLVITDMVMPGNDGLELLATLRRERWPGPILAISGGLQAWSPLPVAAAMGATACLAKPFGAAELIDVVDGLLSGAVQP